MAASDLGKEHAIGICEPRLSISDMAERREVFDLAKIGMHVRSVCSDSKPAQND